MGENGFKKEIHESFFEFTSQKLTESNGETALDWKRVDDPDAAEHGSNDIEALRLTLCQLPRRNRDAVLLLHGGSAQHQSFCVPRGGRSLAEYLWDKGYEPWLLDWRASFKVTDRLEREGKLNAWRDKLDLDNGAKYDLPNAIKVIREVQADLGYEPRTVHALGHCLGAGVLAQAVAQKYLGAEQSESTVRVDRIVLISLGLFYTQPARGKLKASLDVLDKLWADGKNVVDPKTDSIHKDAWPPEVANAYKRLGKEIGPHRHQDAHEASCFGLCDRISFMYGEPYIEAQLAPEIHGRWVVRFTRGRKTPVEGDRVYVRRVSRDDPSKLSRHSVADGIVLDVDWRPETSWREKNAIGRITLSGVQGELPLDGSDELAIVLAKDPDVAAAAYGGLIDVQEAELPKQFGAIPLRMFVQAAENSRRGWAAEFIDRFERHKRRQDRDREPEQPAATPDTSLISDEARRRFHELPAVTLITGGDNTLWYRKSIDDMYQWLTNGGRLDGEGLRRINRKVFKDYGHQDLLWGRNAKRDVFSTILDLGLGGPGNMPRPTERE